MGGIGTWEVVIIMFIVLMVFGSKRIPEIARGLGKGLAEFRRAARDVQNELTREIEAAERKLVSTPSRPVSPEETAAGPGGKTAEERPIWEGGEGVGEPTGTPEGEAGITPPPGGTPPEGGS
jgi:sec-independent protein translocase protein TatA